MKTLALKFLVTSTFFVAVASAQKTISPSAQQTTKPASTAASSKGSQAILIDANAKANDSLNMIQAINAQFDALNQSVALMFAKLQNENRDQAGQLQNSINALSRTNDSLNRKLQQPANINTEKEGPKGSTPNVTHGQVNQQTAQQINQQIASNNQQKIVYQNQVKNLDMKYQQSNTEKQKLNSQMQLQKQKLLQENMKHSDPKSMSKTLQSVIISIQQTSSQVIQNLK